MRSHAAAWDSEGRRSLIGSAGPSATVFQAEILAIYLCASKLWEYRRYRRAISICSDSQAALSALAACTVSSRLVRDCKNALNALGRYNPVSLYWVPAHVGIPGNEKADKMAKRGTLIREPTHEVGAPWSETVLPISRWAISENLTFWNAIEGCRQSKANFKIDPVYRWSSELAGLRRQEAREVVGCMTGHCYFNRHLRLTRVPSRVCRFCAEDTETTEHILWRCPAVDERRMRYLGRSMVDLQEVVPFRPTELLQFIKALGLEERIGASAD